MKKNGYFIGIEKKLKKNIYVGQQREDRLKLQQLQKSSGIELMEQQKKNGIKILIFIAKNVIIKPKISKNLYLNLISPIKIQ